MQVFQWEQRENTTPFYVHMIAGSFAGLSEHLSMIPVDNIKTHCQAGSRFPIHQIAKKIYQTGGWRNFYSGSGIVAVGCVPAHALYFSIYEHSMKQLDCHNNADSLKLSLVGAASSMLHDFIMTPTETIKQRMQLMRGINNKVSTFQVVRNMFKNEGILSFYRSFPVNYAMNIPLGSLIVVFNEKLKKLFNVNHVSSAHFNFYMCGAIAGAIAAIPTCPFDVVKTKLNTQNCLTNKCQKVNICNILTNKIQRRKDLGSDFFKTKRGKMFMEATGEATITTSKQSVIKYRNVIDAVKIIWREDGALGFFKGLKMKMTIQSFSSGIAWGTYHIFKSLFGYSESKH